MAGFWSNAFSVFREFGISDALGNSPLWHSLLSGWIAHIAVGAILLVLARHFARRAARPHLAAKRLFWILVLLIAAKELTLDLPNADFAKLVWLDSAMDVIFTALGGVLLGRYKPALAAKSTAHEIAQKP